MVAAASVRGAVAVYRALLVAAAVAVSVVVLVGAGLLVHSFGRLLDQDLGLRPEELVSANVGLFFFELDAERANRLEQAIAQVAALDGVRAVSASSALPPQTAQRSSGFTVIGRTPVEGEGDAAYWIGAAPGYFSTIGSKVVRGREFEARDRPGSMPVALINESFARELFGDTDPIGRQLRLTNPEAGDAERTIVGVVSDIRYQGIEHLADPTVYTPFAQTPFRWAYLMIRTSTPAERLTPALREAVGSVDVRMAPGRAVQHTELVAALLAQRRFMTLLLGSFAVLALLLAAIGIYGVTATAVTQRRREIGVRLALGARPATVLKQVVVRALVLVTGGMLAGIGAALALTRLITGLLYQVEPRDPVTFVGGGALMIGVALLASALPAWRAARLDPLVTLRE